MITIEGEVLRPIHDAPVTCPACGQADARPYPDDRGVLLRHPYRALPCRAPAGYQVPESENA